MHGVGSDRLKIKFYVFLYDLRFFVVEVLEQRTLSVCNPNPNLLYLGQLKFVGPNLIVVSVSLKPSRSTHLFFSMMARLLAFYLQIISAHLQVPCIARCIQTCTKSTSLVIQYWLPMYVSLKLLVRPILGDPEADCGDEDKANGREKIRRGSVFFPPVGFVLVPTICLWVSEDGSVRLGPPIVGEFLAKKTEVRSVSGFETLSKGTFNLRASEVFWSGKLSELTDHLALISNWLAKDISNRMWYIGL